MCMAWPNMWLHAIVHRPNIVGQFVKGGHMYRQLWHTTGMGSTSCAALTDSPQALTDSPQALTGSPQALTGSPQALTDSPQALTDSPQAQEP